MGLFYGNIKNNQKAPYIFDKIYSSRVAMDTALKQDIDINGATKGDGIFVNRYVLIDYGYSEQQIPVQVQPAAVQPRTLPSGKTKNDYLINSDTYKYYYIPDGDGGYIHPTTWSPRRTESATTPEYYQMENYVDRWDIGNTESARYNENRGLDQERYNADYDLTIWMKIYVDNQERYILVGKLIAEAPAMELVVNAPTEGDYKGGPYFDLVQSSNTNYVYHMPKNWDIALNEYKLNTTYSTSQNVDGYWRYEYDRGTASAGTRTYEYQHEYPYYNAAGFNQRIKSRPNYTDSIKLQNTKSGRGYPSYVYVPIQLTPNTYRKNQYYVYNATATVGYSSSTSGYATSASATAKHQVKASGTTYYLTDEQLDRLVEYSTSAFNIAVTGKYEISTADFSTSAEYFMRTSNNVEDVQRLDIKRLDISLPSIGNSISDVYDSIFGQPSLDRAIGYTASTSGYATSASSTAINKVKINNVTYYLTDAQIDALYHDNQAPHTIPVYEGNSAPAQIRPYTQAQLYKYLQVEPYNNLTATDPISMAWAVEEMQKYISELRFLSHGAEGDNEPAPGKGLQSDWSLNANTAFGYIYHKPGIAYDDPKVQVTYSGAGHGQSGLPPSTYGTVIESLESIQALWKEAKALPDDDYDIGR